MTQKKKPNLFRKLGYGFEDPSASEARARAMSEEQRLADSLGRYKCFYFHNGEVLGPVTLWRVREMIETDLFDPDVQVILEGTDSWRTYAEFELAISPPANVDMAGLKMAAKLPCFYFYGDEICGPASLLVILHKIRLNELPADIQICREGTEVWARVCDIQPLL